MKQPENTREWLEYFDKLRLKNEDAYQQSGEPRYDKAFYKYQCICDAFTAKLEAENERDDTIKKRMTNCKYVVDRLCSQTYTKAEVIDMLQKAVWW